MVWQIEAVLPPPSVLKFIILAPLLRGQHRPRRHLVIVHRPTWSLRL